MERKKVLQIAAGAAGAVCLTLAALWFFDWRFHVATNNAYVRADISAVASKVEGYVAAVLVSDNQRVRAGDVLVRLDAADFIARRDKAAAELARAQAQSGGASDGVAWAREQVESQSETVLSARANLAAAEAAYEKAKADAERDRQLFDKGLVAQSRLTASQTVARQAQAQVAAARAALAGQADQAAASRLNVSRARADNTAASAAVRAARAALEAAELDLARTEVRAPIDGVVGARTVQSGQLVRAGAQLMVVVPLPDVFVVANFKETQIGRMRPGQTVRIKVDALPNAHITGVVDSFAPGSGSQFSIIPSDTASGNFTKIVQRVPVKIRLNSDDGSLALLRPGLSAEATVDTRPSKTAQLADAAGAAPRPDSRRPPP